MDALLHAQNLHTIYPAVDMHFDLGAIVYNLHKQGEAKVLDGRFLEGFKRANFKLIIAAIFIANDALDTATTLALLQINALYKDVSDCSAHFMIIKSYEDFKILMKSNKIGILLSLEGAAPIQEELGLISIFEQLGIRLMGLTWSRRNAIAQGSCLNPSLKEKEAGLTPFGIEVVKTLEDKGIVIDVSHLNDIGFNDVLKHTKGAFIASHSNARHLHSITRNLTDQQIKAIGKRKGLIGINGIKTLVDKHTDRQTIDGLADHIDYIVSLVGVDCVAFGLDLCGLLFKENKEVDIIKNHSQVVLLTAELLRRGYSEADCIKIMGQNVLVFVERILLQKRKE